MSRKIPKKLLTQTKLAWSPFPRKQNFDEPFIKGKPRLPIEPVPFEKNPWQKGKFPRNAYKMKIYNPSFAAEITPIKDWHIVKGDIVEVMTGPDTGKQGKIREIGKFRNQVKVQGLNLRQVKDAGGRIIMVEDPLHYYDVKLVDPTTGLPTDIEIRYTKTGAAVRVCKESERVIEKPYIYKDVKEAILEGPKDTKEDVVGTRTYVPSLLLFHEEVMMEMNIPMSIPKRGPERRDLVMQEIEEDVMAQREQERLEDEEERANARASATPLLDKVKNILPWKK